MRFKDFLRSEAASIPNPYTGKAYSTGPFGLPNMHLMHTPGEMPVGGYQNVQQMVQTNMNREQQYVMNILQTIAILTTNIYQEWQMRTNDQLPTSGRPLYPTANFDQNSNTLVGIGRHEIEGVSGYGMRLQPNQLATAEKMGIIRPDPNNQQYLSINISVLGQAMNSMKEKMKGYKYGMYFAGLADEIMGLMTGAGRVPQSKSTNPMAH